MSYSNTVLFLSRSSLLNLKAPWKASIAEECNTKKIILMSLLICKITFIIVCDHKIV